MTTTYPALRATFGTTEYFVITMRISELVRMVKFPADVQEWGDGPVQEQYQRRIDQRRINRDIAPYFASDKKRFSGSLVMATQHPDGIRFENIYKVADTNAIPYAYGNDTPNMGFVSFEDDELVTLDGQHRAKAFQTVMEWAEHERGKPKQLEMDDGLKDDQVTIILVKFDTSLSRYIFNKINKYARPTSKADKLITDDDDSMAVMTRKLVENGPIPKRLVNFESNSLNRTAHQFTLFSTFHNANRALLSALPIKIMVKPENLKPAERGMRQVEIAAEWRRLISGIGKWNEALQDPSKAGDENRRELRKNSLLGRPLGQLALVKGYAHACEAMGQGVDKDLLVRKIEAINWNIGNDMWRGVLVKPDGKVMYGVRVANVASKMIAHMIGAALQKGDKERVLDFVYGTRRRGRRLPSQVKLQD